MRGQDGVIRNFWAKSSLRVRALLGCIVVIAACLFCSVVLVIGQSIGLIPDYQATDTAKAGAELATTQGVSTNEAATAAVLALTPSATPTPTLTLTITPTFTKTPIPSDTPIITPSITPIPVTEESLSTYYALTGANLRTCPRTTDECSPVAQLSAGDWIMVIGHVSGEVLQGNALWYQARYENEMVYVHSSVLSKDRPQPSNAGVQQPISPTSAPQDPFGCNGINDLDCSDFRARGINANAHLALCGDEDHLDGDGDGRACEPKP